jgi:putative membrane protein
MTSEPQPAIQRFEVRATADSHFGWLRTRLSLERTLMSWVRTGAALIGFGFTIFQFLEHFNATPGAAPATRPLAPWIIGLAMIAAGVASLLTAMHQYHRLVHYLWSEPYKQIAGIDPAPLHSAALAVTVLLAIVGVFAFGVVFLRIA